MILTSGLFNSGLFEGGLFSTLFSSGFTALFHGQTAAIERWKEIYDASRSNSITIPMFGDSQETTSAGGKGYIPRLNYELAKANSYKTGTVYIQQFSSYGGSPPANYMLRGTAFAQTSNLTGAYVPPAFIPKKFSDAIYLYGSITMLQHDCIDVSSEAQIPAGLDLFGKDQPFYVDVWARQYSGSQEILWKYSTQSSSAPGFFNTVISSGTTSLGLDNAANAIIKTTLGPFTNPNPTTKPYNVINLAAASLNNGADVLAAQFRRQVDPGGINIVASSAGGYLVTSFLANHANCGPYLSEAADTTDVVFMHFGANDIYGGKSASTVKADYITLISALRGASFYNNPSLFVVIFTEAPRINGTSAQDIQADLLPDSLKEIADSDANVMIIDTKAMVESAGFTRATGANYLADNVHYNSAGAVLVATVEAAALVYAAR
ncbi:MAG: hypothetical protein IPK63_18260 [Candidatus Competibacteraceae bacterium]|nr:hypothetical protein [Candidatus Competibacteraceae bacterium]